MFSFETNSRHAGFRRTAHGTPAGSDRRTVLAYVLATEVAKAWFFRLEDTSHPRGQSAGALNRSLL